MKELIGIPQVALILGKNRQTVWNWYKAGKLQAVTFTGTEERPRPLFSLGYIEQLKAELKKEEAAA